MSEGKKLDESVAQNAEVKQASAEREKADTKQASQEVKKTKQEAGATTQRDVMDGGFAVVDRERLIAEETKQAVPWYKNIGNLFFSPTKTMNETIEADPIKGAGLGLWVAAFLALIYMLTFYINPMQKVATYDLLRKSGIAEEKLSQQYQLSMISACVTTIVTVAVAAFLTAAILQIIKAIFRDKGKFKKFYIIALFSQVVSFGISIFDNILKYILGTTNVVLGIGSLVPASLIEESVLWKTLAQVISIPNIWALIVLVVGYKVITRKSTIKAVIVVGIYEILTIAYTYGMLMLAQSMTKVVH